MSKKKANKTAARPTAAVEFRAEADGVASLSPAALHSLLFTIRCTQCGCARDNLRIGDEEQEVEGSRATAHFLMSCRDCQRQCKASYVSVQLEGPGEGGCAEWRRILTLDCRGCEIAAVACDNWKITSESNTAYEWDAADDFFEYDAELERPVTVTQVQFRVVAL
jgi:hypothetical protein